ncbi:MAG: translation initiation factor Sui1 [bacterium]|jgi:translation initiation factor 1
MAADNNSRLVYSTEEENFCPKCGKSISRCTCNQKPSPARGDGIVRVGRQTKGRRGRGMTMITGISLPEDEILQLAKQLKQKCGSGGTVRDGIIEIQGDHRDEIIAELQQKGFTVKRSGG